MNLSIAGLLAPETEASSTRGVNAPTRPINEEGGVDHQSDFEQAFARSEASDASREGDGPATAPTYADAKGGEASAEASRSSPTLPHAARISADAEATESAGVAPSIDVGVDGALGATVGAVNADDAIVPDRAATDARPVDVDGAFATATNPESAKWPSGASDAAGEEQIGGGAERVAAPRGDAAFGSADMEIVRNEEGVAPTGLAATAPDATSARETDTRIAAASLTNSDALEKPSTNAMAPGAAEAATSLASGDDAKAITRAVPEAPSTTAAPGSPADATQSTRPIGVGEAADSAQPIAEEGRASGAIDGDAVGDATRPEMVKLSTDETRPVRHAGEATETSSMTRSATGGDAAVGGDAVKTTSTAPSAQIAGVETPATSAASQFAAAVADGADDASASAPEAPREPSPRATVGDDAPARPAVTTPAFPLAGEATPGNTVAAGSALVSDAGEAASAGVDASVGDEPRVVAPSASSGVGASAPALNSGVSSLATPAGQAQLGAAAASQVAAAIVQSNGDSRIELRLDPPELGRVDIELSFEKDGTRVVLRAEREEALDLMRRHADDLLRDLRDAGFDVGRDDLDFSGMAFGGGDANGDGQGEDNGETHRAQGMIAVDAVGLSSHRTASGALDLRV